MLAHLTAFVPSLALLCPASPASPRAKGELTWRGDELETSRLPAEMPDAAQEAVLFWESWVDEHDYRMDLTLDGRLLLITLGDARGARRAKQNLARIEGVIRRMDAILPLPASRSAAATPGEPQDGSYEYGKVTLESATAVLLEMDELEHHVAAVDHIVADHDRLAGWGPTAKGLTGFVLEQPLVAAWQPKAGVKEDWEGQSVNEMVNKVAQLMTLRRFGRLPYWLDMGIAWHVEMAELDGIYCFPYRSGFVSSSEHGDWDKDLRNAFKPRKQEPLTMAEVTGLERGSFDMPSAQIAWGTVTFLVEHHPGALSEINEELHRIWDREGRATNADGTWTRIADFEPSDAAQLAVFEAHVPDFLEELAEFFLEGKGYEKP